MNTKYIEQKIEQARAYIKRYIGLRPVYLEKDIFDILKTFGYVESLNLDEVDFYLPSMAYDNSSIESFTKGFISEKDYRIYAIRMEKHFNLFVAGFNKYREFVNYYSVTISEETLSICFILEQMRYKE